MDQTEPVEPPGSNGAGPHVGDGPHVFVDDLESPVLRDRDRHHLERVLRLRDGDGLTICDGRGAWRRAVYGPEPRPAGELSVLAPAAPEVTVAFAPVKGDRPEWVVQKLTEIGVDRIIPITCDRSVVRWKGARSANHMERLRRIAIEAGMQSRRVHLPIVEDPASFAEVAARDGVALADRGGDPASLQHPTILVGPEGGWTPDERRSVDHSVGLGPHILRTETAALAAGITVCSARYWGGLNA